MAEGARHSYAIRPDQVLVVVVIGIGVVTVCVPLLSGGFIEIGIGEQAQTNDACGIPVVRANRDVFSASAYLHARILAFILERIWRTVGVAAVEPQTVSIRVRAGRLPIG